jgi:hypothetical protein
MNTAEILALSTAEDQKEYRKRAIALQGELAGLVDLHGINLEYLQYLTEIPFGTIREYLAGHAAAPIFRLTKLTKAIRETAAAAQAAGEVSA